MKRVLALTMILALLALTGCECLSGFGRDVQKAGNWVEKEADKHK